MTVIIHENATKRTRFYREPDAQDPELYAGQIFWWEDGNGACDCNRQQRFAEAKDEPYPVELDCGTTRYTIAVINDQDELVFNEFELGSVSQVRIL